MSSVQKNYISILIIATIRYIFGNRNWWKAYCIHLGSVLSPVSLTVLWDLKTLTAAETFNRRTLNITFALSCVVWNRLKDKLDQARTGHYLLTCVWLEERSAVFNVARGDLKPQYEHINKIFLMKNRYIRQCYSRETNIFIYYRATPPTAADMDKRIH